MKIAFTGAIFFNQKVGGVSRYFTMLAKNISENYKIISPLSKNLYLKEISKRNKFSFYFKKLPRYKYLININDLITNNIINFYKPDIVH